MTRDDDFIGQLEGYLDEYEGATPLPAGVRDQVRAQLPTTKQIGGFLMPRRFLTMHRPLQIALAAVAAVAVSVAALSALTRFGIGSEPTPTEDPSAGLGIFKPVAGRIVYGDVPAYFLQRQSLVGSGIWAVDPAAPADPATRVQLTSEAATPLGWSSDGTRLLIRRESRGGERLFVLRADGSETQVTTDPMQISDATISPDGSRVVFTGGSGTIYAVDVDGGPVERLLGPGEHQVQQPTFSPDGTRIAYVHGSGDNGHSVSVMDADGSNAHQILSNDVTLGVGHVRGLAWSPTGDRIALGLEGIIYTFATDGSDFTQIAGGDTTCGPADPCAVKLPRSAESPYWSPDGSQIAYTTGCVEGAGATNRDGCNLAIADADGSNVLTFGFGASGPWHPGTATGTKEEQ